MRKYRLQLIDEADSAAGRPDNIDEFAYNLVDCIDSLYDISIILHESCYWLFKCVKYRTLLSELHKFEPLLTGVTLRQRGARGKGHVIDCIQERYKRYQI
jgi:hypothetical protein